MSTRADNARANLARAGFLSLAQGIADHRHVALDEMLDSGVEPDALEARHELWSLLRARNLSFPDIGAIIGSAADTISRGVRAHTLRTLERSAGAKEPRRIQSACFDCYRTTTRVERCGDGHARCADLAECTRVVAARRARDLGKAVRDVRAEYHRTKGAGHG